MTGILNAPNLLTIFRIVLIGPFLYLLMQGRLAGALIVFFIAGLSDFGDGFLARRWNQQTSFGRLMDPLADKILTTVTFLVLAFAMPSNLSIPSWLAISVVSRDVIILTGSLLLFVAIRHTGFKPLVAGKVNTVLELLFIGFFLLFHRLGAGLFFLSVLQVIVFVSVIFSGLSYVVMGINIYRRKPDEEEKGLVSESLKTQ